MRNLVFFAYTISRPRFWGYTAGPYIIGYAAGLNSQTEILNISFLIHLLYFVFISNILIYGINDYFDNETDKHNLKKSSKEHLLRASERRSLTILILFSLLMTIGMLFLQNSLLSVCLLLLFTFLSLFYSAPPLRFKSRKFLDSSSNILYGIPGFLAYAQLTGKLPPGDILLAASCWTASMHLFSAIPDITPDKKAGIITTAVFLGQKKSLTLCAILWSVTAFLAIMNPVIFPFSILSIIYPLIPIILLTKRELIERAYWYFPYITLLLGFILFLVFFLQKTYV